ncbi:MAG TPA: sodium:calcium antiporter [Chloroflexota bacterium]|nr:sodium:calcium antiporter [Chloroflexota bacterium]
MTPLLLATAGALPWVGVRLLADARVLPPPAAAALSGLAILSAAFLLSWAAEVLQLDVSQGLALALLALIAVLPEYAVDVVFAWRAAADPTQAPYAVANMTGGNRLLIGVGWSAVVLVAWWRRRRAREAAGRGTMDPDAAVRTTPEGDAVLLEPGQSVELAALGAATAYAFLIPLRGGIGLLDAAVLGTLFGVYAWATARAPVSPPHLVGPAATVGALPAAARRLAIASMFVYAAGVIVVSAEPFAHGLVASGAALGVDEFLLVQWLAPLASEAPELVVALMFAWRGLAGAGLRTLVASKVNQWTLLIGTLGAAYSLALGAPADLQLDARQTEELFLTSAQSLFALAIIANFDLSVREALGLLALFVMQLVFPQTEVRVGFAVLYVAAGLVLLVFSRSRRRAVLALPRTLRVSVAMGAAA